MPEHGKDAKERLGEALVFETITKGDGRVWHLKDGKVVKTVFPDGTEIEGKA